jgi:hypothetical protein
MSGSARPGCLFCGTAAGDVPATPGCSKPRALQLGNHEPDRAESAIRIAAAGSPQVRSVYEGS